MGAGRRANGRRTVKRDADDAAASPPRAAEQTQEQRRRAAPPPYIIHPAYRTYTHYIQRPCIKAIEFANTL